jgi:aspartyl-tRNA(Asn)/glutamyl-tRNA(Gln) amidotransferase subunit A
MSDEFAWMPAVEIRDRIAARKASPVEIVTACLSRIEALEPTLHAFITVAAEQALDAARRAESAVLRGDALGPLHGVPIALKDEAWTADMASTGGSLLFGRFVPARDGTVAERLRRAGAIIVGKNNMPEFAAWPRSKSRLAGECVNPWDRTRISGASSGGSGAAVAAGMVPLAVGSDGGGSIRIPSALCGVVGLYPTPGRVPSYGSFSYVPAGSLGPIGRDVRDVALLYQVLAGPDSRDACALTVPVPDVLTELTAGVRGLRVGWSGDFGRVSVDARIVTAVQDALAVLAEAGAVVLGIKQRIEHPWGDGSMLSGLQAAVGAGGGADTVDRLNPPEPPDLHAEENWMWEVFAGIVPFTATEQFNALCRRHLHLLTPPAQLSVQSTPGELPGDLPSPEQLGAQMRALFESHDVICTPTMAVVAPVVPDGWATPYPDPFMGTNFTFIANATGCPAASVPCGLVDGLPVGLQIIGRPGDEATVLRACHAYQQSVGPFAHPSPV